MRRLGCVGFAVLFLTMMAAELSAQPPGTFSLPDLVVSDCSSPVVSISTTEAGGTLGYDFDISFDPLVVSVESVDLGALTADCDFAANFGTPGAVAISIACTQQSFGPGTVASINFVPAGVGSTNLVFEDCVHDEVDCTLPEDGSVSLSGCPAVDLTSAGRGTFGLSPGRVCVSGILATNGASVVSTSNEISFNPAIFAVESCFMNSGLTPLGKSLSRTNLGPGLERVTVSGGAANLPNGVLYACTLTIAGSTPNGTHVVGNEPSATGPGAVSLPTVGADGALHVTSCGADCDGSGSVSIGEVSRASGMFLGDPLCNPTNVNLSCPTADTIDNNGGVSIGEVGRSSCLFLNGICSRTCP